MEFDKRKTKTHTQKLSRINFCLIFLLSNFDKKKGLVKVKVYIQIRFRSEHLYYN